MAGWVPVWYPFGDQKSRRAFSEFERAYFFEKDLERVLQTMHRLPLWGSSSQRKHAVGIALLHLFCEVMDLVEKV